MIIYLITNIINDKKYIGQTKSCINRRFSQHCEERNKTCISYAIKKHGKMNFTIKVLKANVDTQERLNYLEAFYIKKYNTLAPNGYNIEKGGYSPMSQVSRDKLSEKLLGRKITWNEKVSVGVKKLWEDGDYRKKQTNYSYVRRYD